MIEFEIKYKIKSKTAMLYHSWDIEGEEICSCWSKVTKKDIGKLIAFDDGSGIYSRIIGVSDTCITTEIGKFRRDDIVHALIPKWPNANYSGALSSEESIYVRPPSSREKGTVTRLLKGENIPTKFITARINMLSLERMREIAKERGVGKEEWFMDKLIGAADDTDGRNFKYAMDKLGILQECELFNPKGLITNNDNRGVLGQYVGEVTKDTKRAERDDNKVTMNLKTLKGLISSKRIPDKNELQEAEIIPENEITPAEIIKIDGEEF